MFKKDNKSRTRAALGKETCLLAEIEGCVVNNNLYLPALLPEHTLHAKSFLQEMDRNQYRREADQKDNHQHCKDR